MSLRAPVSPAPSSIENEQAKGELLHGLLQSQKTISSKFLYDDVGSRLFNEICKLNEYYQTRTEMSILQSCVDDISWIVGSHCLVIEYGSGTSEKTNIFLRKLQNPAGYIAVDISEVAMHQAAIRLKQEFPHLTLLQVHADFMGEINLPAMPPHFRKVRNVGFFPGSTIGNLEPQEAQKFLTRNLRFLGDGNYFIVGVDLIKDVQVLEAAYNDSLGVTAAFNLNLINRINRELGTGFNIEDFEHHAFFNFDFSRIEMHLVAKKDMSQEINPEFVQNHVQVIGKSMIKFKAGESMHTENSYKYTIDSFSKLVRASGYEVNRHWTDEKERFAVFCLKA